MKLPPEDTRKSRLQLCWHRWSWQSPCPCGTGMLHVARLLAGSGSVFQEMQLVGGSASPASVGSARPVSPQQSAAGTHQPRRSGRTGSSPRQLLCQLGALRKKKLDDVSVAEPTSNTLHLAAVRTRGRGQARWWMRNAFKCRSKLNLNLTLRAGGDPPHSTPLR